MTTLTATRTSPTPTPTRPLPVVVATRMACGPGTRVMGFSRVPTTAWVLERIALWQRYCLPGMLAAAGQTPWGAVARVDWRLLYHPEVSPEALAALEQAVAGAATRFDDDWLTLTLHPQEDPLPVSPLYVRLDSDDVLHPQYLEWVAAMARTPRPADPSGITTIVSAPAGYRFDTRLGLWWETTQPMGPWVAVATTPGAPPVDLYAISHVAWHGDAWRDRVETFPLRGWCQIIHGGNVSNGWDGGHPATHNCPAPWAFAWLMDAAASTGAAQSASTGGA